MEKKIYFTKETGNYLTKYIKCKNPIEKSKIYEKHLYKELDEMIKININVHKFFQTGHELDSLVQELHLHLIEKFNSFNYDEKTGYDKFDPEKGDAFSYCNRMIKNFLIQLQDKRQKLIKRVGLVSLDDEEHNYYMDSLFEEIPDFNVKEFLRFFIKEIQNNMDTLFHKEDEKIICNNIIIILEDSRNNFNNKKMFITMYRNIQKERTYKINKVLSILKEFYLTQKYKYIHDLI
jgi:hypothetical protein